MSQLPPDNSDSQQPADDSSQNQRADSYSRSNHVEGNQNRVVQGDNNKVIQGDNNVFNKTFNYFLNFKRQNNRESQVSVKRDRIQQKLLEIVTTEVQSRINSSLHNRVYIVLDKEQNPSQVESPWQMEVKVGSQPTVTLKNTEIIQIYDRKEIAGRLLILGQPGSGKTTILLKLAEELIKRANDNVEYPVPVLFSISAWKKDNQSIKDWLVEQLKDKYGVRKDIGKNLVENQKIIPLLDGLDELAAERQEGCVRKINEFLKPENWTNPIVVCSRTKEYQYYKTLLQLNTSLELCIFSPQQVYKYLRSTGNEELWRSISNDADLSNLAQTPLLLNIIVLSAQEISVEIWQQFQSADERLNYLFDAYISNIFKRHYKYKKPIEHQTKKWLVWLSKRLIEEQSIEFLIEQMQPHWLKSRFQVFVYNSIVWGIIVGLIIGLVYALIFSFHQHIYVLNFELLYRLIDDWIKGYYRLFYGLFYALFYTLFGEIIENTIEKTIILIAPLRSFTKVVIKGLVFGLICGLISGLINGLISGLTDWLIFGLIFGLVGDKIKTIESLKFNIKKSFYGLIFGLIIGSAIGLIFGLGYGLSYGLMNGLINGLIFGLIIGILGDKIKIIESLKLNLNKSFDGLIIGASIGLLFEIIIGLTELISLNYWLLLFVLIFGLVWGLVFGVDGVEIENKVLPNQGIRQSMINTIIISSWISLFTTPLIFILLKVRLYYEYFYGILITSLVVGLLFGLLIGITRSGTPAIKHLVLRVVLWSNGYIPWNYAKFLNYCTERLFLQRVGGSYRFMHDLLRQHFAKKYAEYWDNSLKL